MEASTEQAAEHVNVLIVGAGISGIGAGYYLQRDHPERSYAILEGRPRIGGTWDLFKYPGIRSDSDLHTFGYEFKPWESEYAIADGPDILAYIREAAAETGVDRHIRTSHRVTAASFASADAIWTVVVEPAGGTPFKMTADFLFCGSGYYDYDEAYTPELPGIENFRGQVIHPQFWPEDLDYTGKRVVVIGSGATAVTIIPAMAEKTEQITMLQRSPSYVLPLPSKDAVSNFFKRTFGSERGYRMARRWNTGQQAVIYSLCQRHPQLMRRLIRRINAGQLPDGYPVDVHFKPKYDPWDQRLCLVPDGDLFRTIRNGKAEVVTDLIKNIAEDGIELQSGNKLAADVIITATGLKLLAFGGINLTVDGEPVKLNDHLAYKGMMLSGIPNFAFLVGYTNASWTLKVGLVCTHFTRILGYMDEHGYNLVVPEQPYPGMTTRPLLDFSAGYVQRALPDFPRQGAYAPWHQSMSVKIDTQVLREGPVEDRSLRFARAHAEPESSVKLAEGVMA